MLHIGKSYIVQVDGTSRLCADLMIKDRRTTLWFGVDSDQEEYLALGRADPFVMALLPAAMRGGHEVVCEDPVSERLHYQLCCRVIPTLAYAGDLYHVMPITAPLTAVPYPNQGAVGTGFSGGVDSLYTIMCHGPGSDYPLTHLMVFDICGLLSEHGSENHAEFYCQAKRFAAEQGLKTVFLRTNLEETLSNAETRLEVCTFRNLARVLSVQGLFSTYLLSTEHDASQFSFNMQDCRYYDPFLVPCASTENLAFYPSGTQFKRHDKLKLLQEWEPASRWLPAGFSGRNKL